MIIIEISSYPKSGNTWFRHLVFQFLKDVNVMGASLDKDIHGQEEDIKRDIESNRGVSIPGIDDKIYFYKSHIPNNPAVAPDKVIYIYRHPLDVLLSTLNWFYIKYNVHPDQFSDARLNQLFLNKTPKSTEEIVSSGEIDYYLHQFSNNLGENFHPGMYRNKGNYFTQVTDALQMNNLIAIKYEDLFQNTSAVTTDTLSKVLGKNYTDIKICTDAANERTKGSGHKFYWKAKSGTRFDYLTNDQIELFESRHAAQMKVIGYL